MSDRIEDDEIGADAGAEPGPETDRAAPPAPPNAEARSGGAPVGLSREGNGGEAEADGGARSEAPGEGDATGDEVAPTGEPPTVAADGVAVDGAAAGIGAAPDDRMPRFAWCAGAAVAALLAMRGVFTASRIFYLRDLTIEFWPRHLWLRRVIYSGQSPLWDPNIGAGQSMIPDPLHQLFYFPALVVRLLLPDVIGFNLWVALPFPVAALGAYLFLRRHASRAGAALGAVIFSVSGPVLSTGNFPNFSWAVAHLFWVLWGVDRLAERRSAPRFATLAALVALQTLAAEPVTTAATCATAGAYALFAVDGPRRLRRSIALAALAALAVVVGGLLAAFQVLPLAEAVRASVRGSGIASNLWALNPVRLFETVCPDLFGNYAMFGLDKHPWITPLNDGREPFLFSLYLGVTSLVVAALGALAPGRRAWKLFWVAAGALFLVLALGDRGLLLPAIERVLPMSSFRYPQKFAIPAVAALAALAALGWDAIAQSAATGRRAAPRAAAGLGFAAGIAAAAFAAWVWLAPEQAVSAFESGARISGVRDAVDGAQYLLGVAPVAAFRLAVLAMASGGLVVLGASGRREAGAARLLVLAVIVLDLLANNSGINRTLDASLLREPSWVLATREHPEDRVYVGGRANQGGGGRDPDASTDLALRDDLSYVENMYVDSLELATYPSSWGVRESISYDLAALWPREYSRMTVRFAHASADERMRFLERTGVRYVLLPRPPSGPFEPRVGVWRLGSMVLYEGPPPAPRVALVREARVEPDASAQWERLFASDFDPSRELLVQAEPPDAAGKASAPPADGSGHAAISSETNTSLVVEASVPSGGAYLRIMDSYDPDWCAEVDGEPAPIVRADGLFRAVRLSEGEHTVAMAYRPAALARGAAVSASTAALLALACVAWSRLARRGARADDALAEATPSQPAADA